LPHRPDVRRQADRREALEDRGQGERRLQPRERRADAVVDAIAEREVLARAPREIEFVGTVEDGLVTVRGADERKDAVAGPDPAGPELRVARGAPSIALDGAVEAEELLDSLASGLRRAAEMLERRRALEERE